MYSNAVNERLQVTVCIEITQCIVKIQLQYLTPRISIISETNLIQTPLNSKANLLLFEGDR